MGIWNSKPNFKRITISNIFSIFLLIIYVIFQFSKRQPILPICWISFRQLLKSKYQVLNSTFWMIKQNKICFHLFCIANFQYDLQATVSTTVEHTGPNHKSRNYWVLATVGYRFNLSGSGQSDGALSRRKLFLMHLATRCEGMVA